MADKPIASNLPADLPTNWQTNQIVSPNGTEAGLDAQHGFNYLAKQVNDAQTGVNAINNAFPGLAAANHTHTAAQIGAVSVSDKATTAEAIAGTNDAKWITPLGAATATRELIANQKWTLLAAYQTAGAFTFTTPAGYTKLGAYMIGGGASGAACYQPDSNYGVCAGGASGYGKNIILTVSPGQQISGVVGAGGAKVNGISNGNAGGTTSFGGSTVAGGHGGTYARSATSNLRVVPGADGGQGSDASHCLNNSDYDTSALQRRLFGGIQTLTSSQLYGGSSVLKGGSSQSPRESQNAFDTSMVTLCAGGWAGIVGSYDAAQTMIATDLGCKGGNGSLTINSNHTDAEDGVGPGSGGGGKYLRDTYALCYSGAGAPGAVYIYGVKE